MIILRPDYFLHLSLRNNTAMVAPNTKTSRKTTQRAKPATPPSAPSKQLDVFDNPTPERDYWIQFLVPEFTCHCPLTGQPDFAHFTIDDIAHFFSSAVAAGAVNVL
jgi:7-cyano-7-deazaguanine reductase